MIHVNTRELLLAHAARYPFMEATDYAKLLYQSAFAGGHLIASREAALNRLADEINAPGGDGFAPLTESIGGGLMRLYLAPARRMGLRAETICGLFVETAASYKPDPARFPPTRAKSPTCAAPRMKQTTLRSATARAIARPIIPPTAWSARISAVISTCSRRSTACSTRKAAPAWRSTADALPERPPRRR